MERSNIYAHYTAGLYELRSRLAKDESSYADTLILEQRLAENIAQTQRYGDTETRRAERAEIVSRLNELAQSKLGVTFLSICGLIDDRHLAELPRAPFMVEDLPLDFVPRPREFEQLIARLLETRRGRNVAITAALRGAGGYGKTTLARAVCHDARIHAAFPDGILWVSLGESPSDLIGRVEDLVEMLLGTRPGFAGIEAAVARFTEVLGDREALMVIDDVWNAADLKPFLQGGPRCIRLITSRDSATLPADVSAVNVDAMQQDEAIALLGAGLSSEHADALRRLSIRLGEWPLLLRLVNGALREQMSLGMSFQKALTYVNEALDELGLTAFDAQNPAERSQAVVATLGVSLKLLTPDERARYDLLAVFPRGIAIPLVVLAKLWGTFGPISSIQIKQLCTRLFRLSLLQSYDVHEESIRLHDVVHDYLVHELGSQLPTAHSQLLDAYHVDRWVSLPAGEQYMWNYLTYHLAEAGRVEELIQLLLDFDWMSAKLVVTDVNAIIVDYDIALTAISSQASTHLLRPGGQERDEQDLRMVQGALRLSAHILTQDKTQLASQIIGRLRSFRSDRLVALVTRIEQGSTIPWLSPRIASLIPPGGPLLRTLTGHTRWISSVAMSADCRLVISAAGDLTLRVWDLVSGIERRSLIGHMSAIRSVAVSADGRVAVSASDDRTVKVWDLLTGSERATLVGHARAVRAVALSANGRVAVSASEDRTLKVWDIDKAVERQALLGHTDWVNAVALTSDGRVAVSASDDQTVRVWDLQTGTERARLTGHTAAVRAVALSANGRVAVSASEDRTLKVWDIDKAAERGTLIGHMGWVRAVGLSANGRVAVSASDDNTLRMWDVATKTPRQTMTGHADKVNAVVLSADGQLAVSASEDRTLKVWDLASESAQQLAIAQVGRARAIGLSSAGELIVLMTYHSLLKLLRLSGNSLQEIRSNELDQVSAVALNGDKRLAVLVTSDGRLSVWDLASGRTRTFWTGHAGVLSAVALSMDGRVAVSASEDRTLKVWDLLSEAGLKTCIGHTSAIRAVAVSADGQLAVSGADDGTLKVWDITNNNTDKGTELRTMTGHTRWVNAVALSADKRFAVSASNDGTLKIWSLAQGKVLTTFTSDSWILACDIAIDGRNIIAGDVAGQVHFLQLGGLQGLII